MQISVNSNFHRTPCRISPSIHYQAIVDGKRAKGIKRACLGDMELAWESRKNVSKKTTKLKCISFYSPIQTTLFNLYYIKQFCLTTGLNTNVSEIYRLIESLSHLSHNEKNSQKKTKNKKQQTKKTTNKQANTKYIRSWIPFSKSWFLYRWKAIDRIEPANVWRALLTLSCVYRIVGLVHSSCMHKICWSILIIY